MDMTDHNAWNEFLRDLWLRKTAEVRQMSGWDIPVDGIITSPLARELRYIADVAEGKVPDSLTETRIRAVLRLAFSTPQGVWIPQAFWYTPAGEVFARALQAAVGDEMVTVTEAAEMMGISLAAMSNRITRGDLQAYRDPNNPNPKHSTRVMREDVEALAKKAETRRQKRKGKDDNQATT